LQVKKSKKVVGTPMPKLQVSKMPLLQLKVDGMRAITVPLPSPIALLPLKAVLQQNRQNLLSLKIPISHMPTTLLSKLRRKWQLLVSWNLAQQMRVRSRTRNGRMPRSWPSLETKRRTSRAPEKRQDANVIDSETLRRKSTSTTASKSRVVAPNAVVEVVAVVTVVTVVTVVIEVVGVADVVILAIVATVKGDIVDVVIASEDVEIVVSEVNTVVAAAAVVVVRVEKARLLSLTTRMLSHLSAAERSDSPPDTFQQSIAGALGGGRPWVKRNQ
jgi:hypothetical protein